MLISRPTHAKTQLFAERLSIVPVTRATAKRRYLGRSTSRGGDSLKKCKSFLLYKVPYSHP